MIENTIYDILQLNVKVEHIIEAEIDSFIENKTLRLVTNNIESYQITVSKILYWQRELLEYSKKQLFLNKKDAGRYGTIQDLEKLYSINLGGFLLDDSKYSEFLPIRCLDENCITIPYFGVLDNIDSIKNSLNVWNKQFVDNHKDYLFIDICADITIKIVLCILKLDNF